MPDLFESSIPWLTETLRASASQTVTYLRGAAKIEDLLASVSKGAVDAQGEMGVISSWEDRTFVIKRSLLVLAGTRILPEIGDKILQTIDDEVCTFEVVSPNGEDRPYQWEDQDRTALRIFTRQIQRRDA